MKGRKTGGRRPGVPNKATAARSQHVLLVKDAFLAAFNAIGGVDRLILWAEKDDAHETLFFQLVARLIPQEHDVQATVRTIQPVDVFADTPTPLALPAASALLLGQPGPSNGH